MESCRREDDTLSTPAPAERASHLEMVDVSQKPPTRRMARARAAVVMAPETLQRIADGRVPKGNVLAAAQVAAIMAVKRTWEILPLCHPLGVEAVEVVFHFRQPDTLEVGVEVSTTAKTGVEMEALTGAAVAALCVYDMCKGIDREMTIRDIALEWKVGGLSDRSREEAPNK